MTASLLRIFAEEGKRLDRRPLHEAIVMRALQAGLAGATVLRGPMGYGRHARVHSARLADLTPKLPLVIEIVDAEERLRPFAEAMAALAEVGLVTLEKVEVIAREG
ncbi:MAG TPA: DUF190 domain-containing protein [Caulobacteraceae bacterium]|jgi:hypothetical protein